MIGEWCNGNTRDFDSRILGSSPSSPANLWWRLCSGSTGVAAKEEGFEFLGIEREAEYVAIAKERLGA